jgi:hypothetical protein
VHDAPSFELGTGATKFEPLADGQDLQMAAGSQGGCHFWLSVRTDGFAQRRFNVAYDVRHAATGTPTGSRSSLKVKLNPILGGEGRCEFVGYTAFLIEPWRFEDRRVRIDVNVEDDLGRRSNASREVIARWPDPIAGRPTDELCGMR